MTETTPINEQPIPQDNNAPVDDNAPVDNNVPEENNAPIPAENPNPIPIESPDEQAQEQERERERERRRQELIKRREEFSVMATLLLTRDMYITSITSRRTPNEQNAQVNQADQENQLDPTTQANQVDQENNVIVYANRNGIQTQEQQESWCSRYCSNMFILVKIIFCIFFRHYYLIFIQFRKFSTFKVKLYNLIFFYFWECLIFGLL